MDKVQNKPNRFVWMFKTGDDNGVLTYVLTESGSLGLDVKLRSLAVSSSSEKQKWLKYGEDKVFLYGVSLSVGYIKMLLVSNLPVTVAARSKA
jgi:hypothetical protein